MALTQPILNSIAAFDATQEHIFSFISIGGDQVLGSQLTIYDNETGAQVYQGNYTSFKFEHPLAAGTLTNGKYYNATISTINNASEFSEPSNPVAFYCYTAPVLTITNIPASGTIEQSNYTFQGNYVQAEGELLNGYQYTLYDSNKEQISQSAILYDGLYQYTFSGMANDTSYYVELSGSTINNTPVSSGLLLFTIRYIQPASFAICDLVNNCQNGFIQISSNIVSIDGKSEPDPPKYIDNKEVDLTGEDISIEQDMKTYWSFVNQQAFNITYDKDTLVNDIKVSTNSGWETVYLPINVTQGRKYTMTFDCDVITQYTPLTSEFKGIRYQVLANVPVNDNLDKEIAGGYIYTLKGKRNYSISFIPTTDIVYFAFNFGFVEDYVQVETKIGNFNLSVGSWVQWDEGFNIQNDFTMRIWGRSFGDNEPIVTMKNELDTNNAPNRIEMKFMATNIIDTLPNYIFAEGDIVTTENAVNEPITDLGVGGNSYQKVVQASSESVKFESDSGSINNANPKLGAKLDIEGNSYQETTQGYNLLNVPTEYHISSTDINKIVPISLKANTIYTIQAEKIISDNSDVKNYLFRFRYNNADVSNPYAKIPISTLKTTYTPPSDIDTVWIYSGTDYNESTTTNTTYTNLMIYEGTAEKSYEPYTGGTPSPNPEYPQDIEVVDGCNLFEINQEHSEFNEQVYIYKYYLKSNTNYTVSTNAPKTNIASLYFNGTSSIANGVYLNRSKTFMSDDKGYLFILIRFVQGTDSINLYQKLLDGTYYIQFNEGSITKPYLPYGSIGLKQSGKNKFDNFKEYSYSNSNLNTTSLNNGIKIEKKSGFGLWVFDNLENLDGKIVRAKSKFNDGGTIAIGLASLDGTSRTIMKENTKSDTVSSFVIPKITDDKKYLAVWLYGSDNSEIYYEDLIVTIDNEDMTYEPYHEPKVISINLQGNTLAKVGDIKGILRVNRNGEIEIKKNIEKIVLTGSEKLVDKSSSTTRTYWAINFSNYGIYQYDDSTKTCDILTTKFKSRPQRGSFLPGQVALMEDSKKVYFIFEPDTTEEQARAILTDMPVYFRLAEPQTIKLSSISPIELWKGTNIFELITNLETVFSITYNIIDASPAPDNPSEVHFTGDIGNQIDFPDTSVSYTDGLHVAAKPNNNYILRPNRIYTLNFDYVVTNSTTDIYYGIGYGTKDNYIGALTINGEENIQYATQNKGSNSITFQTPATFEGVDTPYLWIDFAKTIITATVAVDISNVSLYFGEYTEYQPYGRYNIPFKILGQNLFNYQKLQYFIDNNTTHEVISNGYSISPTIVGEQSDISIGYTNNLVAGIKYRLSYQTLGDINAFKFYKVEKGTSEIVEEITLSNGVFTAPENIYDFMLKFDINSESLTNNVNIWNIQIVEGEQELNYAPYVEKGLNMTFEQPLRGIGNKRDYILLDTINLINPTTLRANVKENTTYYFSNNTTNSYLLEFYNAEDNLIDSEDITKGAFTTPANCEYIKSEDFTTANVTSEQLQIEEGNVFTQYFPYISQPSVIRNISNIELNGKGESYYKQVDNKFLLGYTTPKGSLFSDLHVDNSKVSIISNKFQGVPWNIMHNATVGWEIALRNDSGRTYLRLLTTGIETDAEMLAFIKNNPAKVSYNLDTPQVYNLSGDYAEELRSFATELGINNIMIDSQYPGYIRVKYANSYTEQKTKANYVILKCWNENTIPYMIHSNYITVKSPKDKIFIWTRRKNNIFDLKIENLGEE